MRRLLRRLFGIRHAHGGIVSDASHWTGEPIKLLDMSIQELADSEEV